MECSLAALIACFSWSGLYIDSGLSYQDSGGESKTVATAYDFYGGEYHLMWTGKEITSARSSASNPYGRLSLGYQIDFRSVSWRVEASHLSSLATDTDRGVNSISVSARWFPFR